MREMSISNDKIFKKYLIQGFALTACGEKDKLLFNCTRPCRAGCPQPAAKQAAV